MPKVDSNGVSLAGEFAVLSQLSFHGYDANMTLGRTKGVDILLSDQDSGRMPKLEVKTNFRSSRSAGGNSKLFGKFESAWMMGEKHEELSDENLFYCFVNMTGEKKAQFRFFIVPSKVVSEYVKQQHQLWLDADQTHARDNTMRTFRIGLKGQTFPIHTPSVEDYEDNWEFKS